MVRAVVRRLYPGLLMGILLCAVFTPATVRGETTGGFLVTQGKIGKPGPEARAARRLAGDLDCGQLTVATGDGQFVDENGKPISLDRFDVIWYHQGDATDQTGPIHDAKTLDALKKYVADGGGLFLSGAALAMVHAMQVEPMRPRLGGPGNDASRAMLRPLVKKHPAFRGLAFSGSQVQISDAGHPAFADFHGTPGPTGGMLLAQTGGSENALVEYELGKGRIIAMGWRLPHYAHATNAHRENLQRLTGNILDYLAQPEQWQKVVIRPVPRGPVGPKKEPGVPEEAWTSLRLAVEDLAATFGDRYPSGTKYLEQLETLRQEYEAKAPDASPDTLDAMAARFNTLKTNALLANPLFDFDRLLLVRRSAGNLALPTNWQSNSSLSKTGHDNQIAVLSPVRPDGKITTLFRPDAGRFVGDVDLHFDARKMLFSMPGANGRWQLFELNTDGTNLREVTTIEQPDVDNYDACYLPDERIVFNSTAPFVGVPCVRGASHVTNLYLRATDGGVRQLTVDQEHNWCPTVMNNGRVLYLRWEYADTPHAFYRLLFHMNPDGTEQMEYYGSNSYWPNAMFYARPIPNHPTQVVAVVGGHHDRPRMGQLVIFDPAKGRFEADGVVARIPGRGQTVEPVLLDGLTQNGYPRFLHPYPLSEKQFLVSCRPDAGSTWGIYLVDTFDNFVLLAQQPGDAERQRALGAGHHHGHEDGAEGDEGAGEDRQDEQRERIAPGLGGARLLGLAGHFRRQARVDFVFVLAAVRHLGEAPGRSLGARLV